MKKLIWLIVVSSIVCYAYVSLIDIRMKREFRPLLPMTVYTDIELPEHERGRVFLGPDGALFPSTEPEAIDRPAIRDEPARKKVP